MAVAVSSWWKTASAASERLAAEDIELPTATHGESLRPAARQILLRDDKAWVDDSASTGLSATAPTQVTVENLKEVLPVQQQGSADVWAERESSGQLLRAVLIAAFENGYRDLGLVVQTAEGHRRLPFEAVENRPAGNDVRVNLHMRRVEVNRPSSDEQTDGRLRALEEAIELGVLEGIELPRMEATASYDVQEFAKTAHELFVPGGPPGGNVTVLFSNDTSTETVAIVLFTLHQARSSVDEGARRAITFSIPQKRQKRSEKVKIGTPQVDGHLSVDVVAQRLEALRGRFEKCHELGVKDNPELGGTVRVRFVIGRQGGVVISSPAGTFSEAKVGDCLARVLYGASFPVPQGGTVSVEVPIELSP